ncbi:MAG: hypothetical protein LBR53_11920 [Deltaproteobacteria bacterium]|jgi:hypothetical protein|nr:hypothetical protein [Deltaproteobacteria bacterium]
MLIETLYKIWDEPNKYIVYKEVDFTYSNLSEVFAVASSLISGTARIKGAGGDEKQTSCGGWSESKSALGLYISGCLLKMASEQRNARVKPGRTVDVAQKIKPSFYN